MAEVIAGQPSDVGALNLLYVCDFPPSDRAGGDILMKRLLAGHSSNRLIVLAASHLTRVACGHLNCRHIKFPRLGGTRPFRLKTTVDWLLVPVLASFAVALIIRYRVRAIITVAHGHFFIAAAMASFITRKPFVLVVHDDWVSSMKTNSRMLKHIASPIFRGVVRNAAHVYSVSPQMHRLLKTDYGIDSEIQFPATELHCEHLPEQCSAGRSGNAAIIIYSGIWSHAVEDTLGLMADIVSSGALEKHGLKNVEFHLYTNFGRRNLEWPWNHPSIRVHGWVSQADLQVILADGDILFLPFSFSEAAKFSVESGFPSKTADYLASGKPILVVGPPYSTIVRYAEQNGFAAVVNEPDPEAIAVKIKEIIASASLRECLRANSLAAFEKNHNIVRQRAAFCSTLSKISSS
jgi:glycosyltransferase involved in cell wall biosynthesis